MKNNWEIYDSLINEIPGDLIIEECIIGLHWTFVRAGRYCGIAATFQGSSISGLSDGPIIGKSLRDAAAGVKSWDMLKASMGMAACNAWFNAADKMTALGIGQENGEKSAGTGQSIFDEPMESLIGKKVAVIGHFPYIEKQLGGKCELSILEREPEGTDLLDSACEYVLPEQDYVFITGMTLTNKTLPRLLTLSQNAKTVLVGPSSPITPILFRFGVDSIAGFYITDPEETKGLAAQAAHKEIFRGGRRITLSK